MKLTAVRQPAGRVMMQSSKIFRTISHNFWTVKAFKLFFTLSLGENRFAPLVLQLGSVSVSTEEAKCLYYILGLLQKHLQFSPKFASPAIFCLLKWSQDQRCFAKNTKYNRRNYNFEKEEKVKIASNVKNKV